jgi:hypothetical protein
MTNPSSPYEGLTPTTDEKVAVIAQFAWTAPRSQAGPVLQPRDGDHKHELNREIRRRRGAGIPCGLRLRPGTR